LSVPLARVEATPIQSDAIQVPWCSGPTCVPVKDEIASSNLVGTAGTFVASRAELRVQIVNRVCLNG
jgi:hypothetical protein